MQAGRRGGTTRQNWTAPSRRQAAQQTSHPSSDRSLWRPTCGTMISAQASKMLEVDPLCALFTSWGRDRGNAAPSQAAYWSR